MKKKNSKTILVALGTLVAFALWTFLIRCVDVQPIGPNGSRVGFAAINGACVRYEKARKVEKEFSCLCIMKEKVREGICNQKIKSSSGDSDRTI